MGSCVVGGVYFLIMFDEVLIVDGIGFIFLVGFYLVKVVIGEDVDKEILGGVMMYLEIFGVIDYKMLDD